MDLIWSDLICCAVEWWFDLIWFDSTQCSIGSCVVYMHTTFQRAHFPLLNFQQQQHASEMEMRHQNKSQDHCTPHAFPTWHQVFFCAVTNALSSVSDISCSSTSTNTTLICPVGRPPSTRTTYSTMLYKYSEYNFILPGTWYVGSGCLPIGRQTNWVLVLGSYILVCHIGFHSVGLGVSYNCTPSVPK